MLVFGVGIYGFLDLNRTLIKIFALLSVIAGLQIWILNRIDVDRDFYNSYILPTTLGYFPQSDIVCRNYPLSLDKMDLSCDSS